MKVKRLSFQVEAVSSIIDKLKKQDTVRFQAPTGSGKTFMLAKTIEQFLINPELNINHLATFIFIAPSSGALDHQGYIKFKNFLDLHWVNNFHVKYIGIKEGSNRSTRAYLNQIDYFKANTVYFIGWSMFGRNANISKVNSERNTIDRTIKETQNNNIKIHLIIDEAHREVNKKHQAETKTRILQTFKACKRIEMSATLKTVNLPVDVEVKTRDVRAEKFIKKKLIINPISKTMVPEKTVANFLQNEKVLIACAIQQQRKVEAALEKEKLKIKQKYNPLILVQIPDKKPHAEVDYEQELTGFLETQGFRRGLNYAVWLHRSKTAVSKQDITANNSRIKILLFKQAIATGWDIPRANILVRLRDIKTPTFYIQTIGRIMRNNITCKYYGRDEIDSAYVFTNYKRFEKLIEKELPESLTTKKVALSAKGKKTTFTINKILLQKELKTEQIINDVFNQVRDPIFKKFNDPAYRRKVKVLNQKQAHGVIAGEDVIKEALVPFQNQMEFSDSESAKKSLYEVYMDYLSIFYNEELILQIIERVANNASHQGLLKKDFYLCCYRAKDQSDWSITDQQKTSRNVSLLDYLEFQLNKQISKFTNRKSNLVKKPFRLQQETTYRSDLLEVGQTWDTVNSYDFALAADKLDSKLEERFYEFIQRTLKRHIKNDSVHIFRNKVDEDSYYVQYINRDYQRSNFYPDFILIDDKNQKGYIIEIKGSGSGDIDRNTEYKMKAINNYQPQMLKNYEVLAFKATWDKKIEVWNFSNDKESISENEFLRFF